MHASLPVQIVSYAHASILHGVSELVEDTSTLFDEDSEWKVYIKEKSVSIKQSGDSWVKMMHKVSHMSYIIISESLMCYMLYRYAAHG